MYLDCVRGGFVDHIFEGLGEMKGRHVTRENLKGFSEDGLASFAVCVGRIRNQLNSLELWDCRRSLDSLTNLHWIHEICYIHGFA